MYLPDDKLPIINRPATIYGVSITFQALAWIAVAFRIFARVWLAHSPGWDDLFVIIASLGATVGTVILCLTPSLGGLGQHMWALSIDKIDTYLKFLYIANCLYISATSFIKTSILFQYLRLFTKESHPHVRKFCWGMLFFVWIWGATFFFLAVFSCTPVEKAWDIMSTTGGNCMLFASRNPDEFYAAFTSFAATNLFIDVIILSIPIPFWKDLARNKKSKWALVGLLAVGLVVISISATRVSELVLHHAGTQPIFDLTWWGPPNFITTVLEVQVATICASMPIFWPIIERLGMGTILVVNEVVVTRTESQMAQRDVEEGTSDGDSFHKDIGIAGWDDAVSSEERDRQRGYKHWSTHARKVAPPVEQIAAFTERQ